MELFLGLVKRMIVPLKRSKKCNNNLIDMNFFSLNTLLDISHYLYNKL